MNADVTFSSLSATLDETNLVELMKWWDSITPTDRDDLTELTRLHDLQLPYEQLDDLEDKPDDELVNDLYDYMVNHEIKGLLQFFGTVSRDGYWGTFIRNVEAIPLCDPDWPPYSDSLQSNPWKPRGKLRDADLGFV